VSGSTTEPYRRRRAQADDADTRERVAGEIRQRSVGVGIALGLSLGLAVGSGLGVAFGNVALGVAVGMCFGLAIGVAIGSALANMHTKAAERRSQGQDDNL
jgi:hypothetical protein